jgi:death-on-curing protein
LRRYLSLDNVVAIHRDLIDRYGGSDVVADPDALKRAITLPRPGFSDDVVQEAAILWEKLGQGHFFIQGNQRSALAVAITFLAINGIRLTADSDEIYEFVTGVCERNGLSYGSVYGWLNEHCRQVD